MKIAAGKAVASAHFDYRPTSVVRRRALDFDASAHDTGGELLAARPAKLAATR